MKRSRLPKIPAIEEIEPVACAVQNILLGATALNIASFWSTGGCNRKITMYHFRKIRMYQIGK
jgi:hypothetical protein